MSYQETPLIFDLLAVAKKYGRQMVLFPIVIAVVTWLASSMLPKVYSHTVMFAVGEDKLIGTQLASAANLADINFKGKTAYADSWAQVKSVEVTQAYEKPTWATIKLEGGSFAALDAASAKLVGFIENSLRPNWEVHYNNAKKSLDEIDLQISNATQTAESLKARMEKTEDVNKVLTQKLAFESVMTNIQLLRTERSKISQKLADLGDKPFQYSQNEVSARRMVFPTKGRYTIAAFFGSLLIAFILGYALHLMDQLRSSKTAMA